MDVERVDAPTRVLVRVTLCLERVACVVRCAMHCIRKTIALEKLWLGDY
jgi:hypothetical protein